MYAKHASLSNSKGIASLSRLFPEQISHPQSGWLSEPLKEV
jgi:hypothetical protein